MTKEIISRDEAKEQGLKRYFTGEPCRHGHLSERRTNDGKCAECVKIRRDKYYQNNKDVIINRQQKYYQENSEKVNARRRQHYKENHETILEKRREYVDKNRDKVLAYMKDWRENNKEWVKESQRRWREENKEKVSESHRRWYLENRDKKLAKHRQWYENNKDQYNKAVRKRYNADPNVKLAAIIRKNLRRTLNGDKNAPTFEEMGYTPEELRIHIEAQFEQGMSWDNRKEWHIDHIIPISYLIEQGETDPAVINALENLRPMWATENLSKGA